MAAKQTIKYTRTRKRKSPSPKKCPSCGRFLGQKITGGGIKLTSHIKNP